MNALVIDCASNTLTVAAQKENSYFQTTAETGLSQSEKLLPIIDSILNHLKLKPNELDFTAVTQGPGSFTGLRLGLSTLKALTLSHDIPLYGLNSLDVYAYHYKNFNIPVLSLVESKDKEFFYSVYKNAKTKTVILPSSFDQVLLAVKEEPVVIASGPGAKRLRSLLSETGTATDGKFIFLEGEASYAKAMIALALEMIEQKKPALQDYDGPIYYKKSEAEIVLESKQNSI